MYSDFWKACEAGDLLNTKRLAVSIEDINFSNPEGWNAIILSAFNHHIEVVSFLLENGANINSRGLHGTTVLMYAKTKVLQNNNYAFLDFLIENGADLNLKDYKRKWSV